MGKVLQKSFLDRRFGNVRKGGKKVRIRYLRVRTSVTVFIIPLSRRHGKSTAMVFWPATPLDGSHIFTHTLKQKNNMQMADGNHYEHRCSEDILYTMAQTESQNDVKFLKLLE